MKIFLRVFFIALLALQISPAYPFEERTTANMPDAPAGHPHSPLGQAAESMLKANGFVVVPGRAQQNMFETYHALRAENAPIFVTTDSILHAAHRVFAQVLELMETKHLSGDLRRLTRFMLQQSMQDAAAAEHAQVMEALQANVAFFSVAARLLGLDDAVPADLESLVDQEIELIKAHQGFAKSPALGYLEDYSQYVPRGRYTQSQERESYFLAMTWYGRAGFYAGPAGSLGVADGLARRLTRQALLMVRALDQAGEGTALPAWERINRTAEFFVGLSDDLDIHDYRNTALLVYGRLPDDADLADESRLGIFLSEIQKARPPKILSSLQFDAQDKSAQAPPMPLGFRFLGQRALPDAWILQNLVYPRVMDYTGQSQPFTLVMSRRGPIRGMPRGLDVMAVLGSDLAAGIIRAEGDADYEMYDRQVEKLRQAFALRDQDEDWAAGLASRWLLDLRLLLAQPRGDAPGFMRSEAWTGKMLNTALGSWTELRHDTILYAKQSYSEKGTGLPRPVNLTRGGVEPCPELFARVRDMARALRTNDCTRDLIPTESTRKLREFEDLLVVLANIAAKELAREPLSEEEFKTIWNIGVLLERATTLPLHEAEQTRPLIDHDMAVVADVHTDPNSAQVLQVAVGRPFIIYVRMARDGMEQIAAGPVYSCYEFKQPMADRLTNEQWREMLRKGQQPPLPAWTGGFAVQ